MKTLAAAVLVGLALIAGAMVYGTWEQAESARCDRLVAGVSERDTVAPVWKERATKCLIP